ncbi:MAG TPA: hypothetical protein VGN20_09950 [Mucilaginibacter sp.]
MKNVINRKADFCFLAALLILALSTCKKDVSSGDAWIVGKWSNRFLISRDIVQQYQFKSNDSVEFYAFKIDTVTKSIIGYSYRTIGKYKVDGKELTLYGTTSFLNPANGFGSIAQLVKSSGPTTSMFNFSLNDKKNQLSFYFVCPLNADCIASPVIYYKE